MENRPPRSRRSSGARPRDVATNVGVVANYADLGLRVPVRPFSECRVLLFLRQLEMFLAEEPESGSFRPVLATRVVAAHVDFTAAQFASYAISATASSSGNSESRGDALRENLSKPVDQRIEWVGRTSGHGC